MVNSFVAGLIYERFFRGLSFDEGSRKYRFSTVTVTDSLLTKLVEDCDCMGHVVYKEDILEFLDCTLSVRPDTEEWTFLPLELVSVGEVICIRGLSDCGSTEFRLIKMSGSHWLVCKRETSQNWRQVGLVEIPEKTDLTCDSTLMVGSMMVRPSFIGIERPSSYHRLLDGIVLSPAYAETTPVRIIGMYNELLDMHRTGLLCRNMEHVINLTSGNGVSTFGLRTILDYLCID